MRILVFDTAYRYELIRKRGIQDLVKSKSLGGFFSKVIVANFSSNLLNLRDDKFKKTSIYKIDKNNIIIESGFHFKIKIKFFRVFGIIFGLIIFFKKLIKYSKRFNINFVRAEDPLVNGILAFIISKIFNIPLIICVWGNPKLIRETTNRPIMSFLFSIKIEEFIEKFILRKANKIIVSCKEDMNFVVNTGISKNKIFVVSMLQFIQKIHYEMSDEKNRNSNIKNKENFNLACISRLEKVKNVEDLIDVMNIIYTKNDKVDLYLIGDGSQKIYLQKKVKKYNLINNIHFVGDQSQKWIAKFLRGVDLIVSPLTGRALLEALVSGTPVLGYDINIHKDYIKNNKNGFLVQNRNIEKLSKKILDLSNKPHFLRKIGMYARKSILEEHNIEKNIHNQVIMYKKLFNNNN